MFLRYLFSQWLLDPASLTAEEVSVYVRAYQQAGAVHGFCSDYRAAGVDVAQDQEDADVKIACPTLALWGRDSVNTAKLFDVKTFFDSLSTDIYTSEIPQCGHFPHEESPAEFNEAVLRFLEARPGDSGVHSYRLAHVLIRQLHAACPLRLNTALDGEQCRTDQAVSEPV